MIRNICTALTLCTVIAAGTAGAQVAGTAPGTSSAATDTGTIQEVVVTARRYAEDLQSTPLAVTALSASTIQMQDVTNLEDLNSFVPNFKIAADRATSSTINVYIRGVSQIGFYGPPRTFAGTVTYHS
jgi:iron complex outermembrane receptor protein